MKRVLLTCFLASLSSACGGSNPAPPIVVAPTPIPEPPAPAPAPPPSPTSTVPVITGISAHFSDQTCTRHADGLQARALVITFNYVNGGDDLNGGEVKLTRVYNTGRSEWHDAPIPSEVRLIGSQQYGEAEMDDACPLYDNSSSETETLVLVDANGNASNSLSVTMTRPEGDK